MPGNVDVVVAGCDLRAEDGRAGWIDKKLSMIAKLHVYQMCPNLETCDSLF